MRRGGGGGGAYSQSGSAVNEDSGNRGVGYAGINIDEGDRVYAPVPTGYVSWRWFGPIGLNIHQVNVAAVDSAEVSGHGHFVGLSGLPSTRGYGTIFPVLGFPLDGPDLWNFDHMDSRRPSMISEIAGPTGSACAPARVRTVRFRVYD